MAKLEELLVDGSEVDRELVGTILAPYIRIDRTNASIIPTERWDDLSARSQVLIFLAARKAMRALGIDEAEEVAPGDIEAATGLLGGTVRPALMRLSKQRLIARADGNRGYYLPNWALNRVKAELRLEEE